MFQNMWINIYFNSAKYVFNSNKINLKRNKSYYWAKHDLFLINIFVNKNSKKFNNDKILMMKK